MESFQHVHLVAGLQMEFQMDFPWIIVSSIIANICITFNVTAIFIIGYCSLYTANVSNIAFVLHSCCYNHVSTIQPIHHWCCISHIAINAYLNAFERSDNKLETTTMWQCTTNNLEWRQLRHQNQSQIIMTRHGLNHLW